MLVLRDSTEGRLFEFYLNKSWTHRRITTLIISKVTENNYELKVS